MQLPNNRRPFVRAFFGAGAALVVLVFSGCVSRDVPAQKPLTRIGFGSCINTQSHPMLDRTLTLPFELFILLGDNIYADTTNPAVMAEKYRVRKESAFFQALRKKAPLLATWDDHDFGGNDAGASYPMKSRIAKALLRLHGRAGGFTAPPARRNL
jgi:alkaline phosphatase D